jgi:hypothetical protein
MLKINAGAKKCMFVPVIPGLDLLLIDHLVLIGVRKYPLPALVYLFPAPHVHVPMPVPP